MILIVVVDVVVVFVVAAVVVDNVSCSGICWAETKLQGEGGENPKLDFLLHRTLSLIRSKIHRTLSIRSKIDHTLSIRSKMGLQMKSWGKPLGIIDPDNTPVWKEQRR